MHYYFVDNNQENSAEKNILLLAVGMALHATPTPSWWGRFAPPPPQAPRARKSLRAIVVVSLCTTYEYR